MSARSSGGDASALRLVPDANPPAFDAHSAAALLALGREVALASAEEALVAALARAIRSVFPGCHFCVRVVDPRTLALTALHAEGPLLPGAHATLRLRRALAEELGLDPHAFQGRVIFGSHDAPLFRGAAAVLTVPLVSSGQLFGVLDVEGPSFGPHDEEMLVQIAVTASVGIRNTKLIEELTFLRKYHEELLESANALIVVVDRAGKVRVFNRALSELSGWAREEVLGRDLLELVPEAERAALAAVLGHTEAGRGVSDREVVLRHRGGGELRVALSTAAVVDASGQVEGVIAIGQDLTRLRELEGRVVQAEKLASLGRLAAGVAHEINNPLTSMVMSAEWLAQRFLLDPDRAPELDRSRRIVEGGRRILGLSRDLMSYARPVPDRRERVSLPAVIEEALATCEHVIAMAGVRIEREILGAPAVSGKQGSLVQVVVNLVTNACQAVASSGQGGRIRVRARGVDGGVELAVIDDGPGIPPSLQPRLFEPFFTTKSEGQGTGLGLSIVHGIVAGHGGAVRVESRPGEGAAFLVTFPAAS
jgi:two-component system NtrC family sensor kinase